MVPCSYSDKDLRAFIQIVKLKNNKYILCDRIIKNSSSFKRKNLSFINHFERVEKLMAVVGVALLLCFMVGRQEEVKSPTPFRKTVQSPVFSTFRRSFDYLRKLLFQMRDEALILICSFLPTPIKTNAAYVFKKSYGSEIEAYYYSNFNNPFSGSPGSPS